MWVELCVFMATVHEYPLTDMYLAVTWAVDNRVETVLGALPTTDSSSICSPGSGYTSKSEGLREGRDTIDGDELDRPLEKEEDDDDDIVCVVGVMDDVDSETRTVGAWYRGRAVPVEVPEGDSRTTGAGY